MEGDAAAWRLANKMCTLLLVFMSGVTLLGILLSPQLIEVLGHGFHAVPGKFELAVALTRIMYPFILLVSLAALAMGMLNAKNVFGAPALASSFFNLGSIVGGVSIGWFLNHHYGPENLPGHLGHSTSSRRSRGKSGGCTAWPSARCWAVFCSSSCNCPPCRRCITVFTSIFAGTTPGCAPSCA